MMLDLTCERYQIFFTERPVRETLHGNRYHCPPSITSVPDGFAYHNTFPRNEEIIAVADTTSRNSRGYVISYDVDVDAPVDAPVDVDAPMSMLFVVYRMVMYSGRYCMLWR